MVNLSPKLEQRHDELPHHQKKSWNVYSPGMKIKDELMTDILKPTGYEIMHFGSLKENDVMLIVISDEK